MKQRKKEKRIKRNEDNLRDLWDNVKRPNIRIIGVPEEEDKRKDHEKILERIVENFSKMGMEIITQVQETQRVPNRINPLTSHNSLLDTSLHSREKKSSSAHQNTNTSFPNQETLTSHQSNPTHREETPQ